MSKVSVVMPVFNAARYLRAAVDSVLNQTLSSIEVIVIDDGSTDKSPNVLESISDRRLKVIRLESNSGLVNALNLGISEARGELIARMDADDVAFPTRLQEQFTLLMGGSVAICGTAIELFGIPRGHVVVNPASHSEIGAVLPIVCPVAHPTVMVRREVFAESSYRALDLHYEDYALWSRLWGDFQFANLTKPLLKYRVHGAQISSTNRSAQHRGMAITACDLLTRMGRFRTPDDLNRHSEILRYAPIDSLDALSAAGEWLMWLKDSFGVRSEAVDSAYLSVWRRFCCAQTHLGARVYPVFCRFLGGDSSRSARMRVLFSGSIGVGSEHWLSNCARRLFRL